MGRYIGVFTLEDGTKFEASDSSVAHLVQKSRDMAAGKKIVNSFIVYRERENKRSLAEEG